MSDWQPDKPAQDVDEVAEIEPLTEARLFQEVASWDRSEDGLVIQARVDALLRILRDKPAASSTPTAETKPREMSDDEVIDFTARSVEVGAPVLNADVGHLLSIIQRLRTQPSPTPPPMVTTREALAETFYDLYRCSSACVPFTFQEWDWARTKRWDNEVAKDWVNLFYGCADVALASGALVNVPTRDEIYAALWHAEQVITGSFPGATRERGDRTAPQVRTDAILAIFHQSKEAGS